MEVRPRSETKASVPSPPLSAVFVQLQQLCKLLWPCSSVTKLRCLCTRARVFHRESVRSDLCNTRALFLYRGLEELSSSLFPECSGVGITLCYTFF